MIHTKHTCKLRINFKYTHMPSFLHDSGSVHSGLMNFIKPTNRRTERTFTSHNAMVIFEKI